MRILERALADERGLGGELVDVDDGVLEEIARRSQGDARFALNTLELASSAVPDPEGRRRVTREVLADALV